MKNRAFEIVIYHMSSATRWTRHGGGIRSKSRCRCCVTSRPWALERKDPQRKLERRKKRAERSARTKAAPKVVSSTAGLRPDEVRTKTGESPVGASFPRSRHVPAELRELVFARADSRCQFVDGEGARCRERTGLQVDHVVPFGRRGPTVLRNLRLLCRSHNLWAAKQVYGAEFVQAKIAGARSSG